jgi:hypothetical protein
MKLIEGFDMFKRTLVALGLAATAAQGYAATIASTTTTVTPQFIETATNVTGADVVVTTAAAIASGAILNVTYSAAPTNPAAITSVVTNGGGCAGGADTLTYAGATNSGKTLNYTFVTGDGNPSATNCTLTLGGPAFAKADVNTTGITVSSSFTVVGAGVDATAAGADATSVKLGKDQFTLTGSTKANAVIDVNSPALRTAYVTGTTDALTLTANDSNATANTSGATAASSKIVVTGDFSWADDAATTGFQIKGTAIALTHTGGGAAPTLGTGADKPTATTITILDSAPADGDTYTLTFTPQVGTLKVELPVTTFSATSTTTYTDSASSTGTQSVTAAAGKWTLNGATVTIYSVPFGPEVESHSIFVSNAGTTTGEITGSMLYAGNDAVKFSMGNIEPKSNKYINLMSILSALGEKPAFGRADVTFTVNAPAADITLTAAYNTAEGRANLFMQEQANIATISSEASTQATAAATDAGTAATQSTAANTDAGCIKAAMSQGVDTGVGSVVVGTAAGIVTGIGAGFLKFSAGTAGC